jgi:hypothetical protein
MNYTPSSEPSSSQSQSKPSERNPVLAFVEDQKRRLDLLLSNPDPNAKPNGRRHILSSNQDSRDSLVTPSSLWTASLLPDVEEVDWDPSVPAPPPFLPSGVGLLTSKSALFSPHSHSQAHSHSHSHSQPHSNPHTHPLRHSYSRSHPSDSNTKRNHVHNEDNEDSGDDNNGLKSFLSSLIYILSGHGRDQDHESSPISKIPTSRPRLTHLLRIVTVEMGIRSVGELMNLGRVWRRVSC